jgi:hypothetical protein
MKALNFLPLLIWALCWFPIMSLCAKLEGRSMSQKTGEAVGAIYIIGILAFLVIGCLCATGGVK